jgi:hypothetical protein
MVAFTIRRFQRNPPRDGEPSSRLGEALLGKAPGDRVDESGHDITGIGQ